jgi:hypothetical protein
VTFGFGEGHCDFGIVDVIDHDEMLHGDAAQLQMMTDPLRFGEWVMLDDESPHRRQAINRLLYQGDPHPQSSVGSWYCPATSTRPVSTRRVEA